MTFDEFRNAYNRLRFIDQDDFFKAGGDIADWQSFKRNPHQWVLHQARDDVARKVFALTQK